MTDEDRVRAMYEAFNARDLDALAGMMAPDVDWPNAWEGGRLRGPEAVRTYWERQWAAIDPTIVPGGIVRRGDGSLAVDVEQTVRSLHGEVIGQGPVVHVYRLADGLIERMDVEAG